MQFFMFLEAYQHRKAIGGRTAADNDNCFFSAQSASMEIQSCGCLHHAVFVYFTSKAIKENVLDRGGFWGH